MIGSYNNEQFCERNLRSIKEQTFTDYRIIYIDDCSLDSTYEKVKKLKMELDLEEKMELIQNKERLGILENHYNAIHRLKNDEIVILLDGDDWFYSPDVLAIVDEAYQNLDTWVTYGQFVCLSDGQLGCAVEENREALQKGKVRYHWIFSHLKTFYASLFKKIALKDLQKKGKFLPSAGDLAIMYPIVEMAREHTKFIPTTLVVYNDKTGSNDHLLKSPLQRYMTRYIQSLKPYEPFKGDPRE